MPSVLETLFVYATANCVAFFAFDGATNRNNEFSLYKTNYCTLSGLFLLSDCWHGVSFRLSKRHCNLHFTKHLLNFHKRNKLLHSKFQLHVDCLTIYSKVTPVIKDSSLKFPQFIIHDRSWCPIYFLQEGWMKKLLSLFL